MWSVRIVMLALLGLFVAATWLIGVMLDRPDLLWGMLFATLAGMLPALLVLATASRTVPEPATVVAYHPQTEDDAPHATWPEPAMQDCGDEEFMDAPELPAAMLWRMRRLQEDARRRGWECADVDEWLAQNAERIEADCRELYGQLVTR